MSKVLPFGNESTAVEFTMSDPQQAAGHALAAGLDYCVRQMKLAGPQAALDELRQGSAQAQGYFQYAVAKAVAEYVAAFDEEALAVYLTDDEATPEDAVFGETAPVSLIKLIVHAHRKTDALIALLAALDRALASSYAEAAGLPGVAHLVDAQLIDDEEVRRGTGWAALLKSLYHRPLQVWAR